MFSSKSKRTARSSRFVSIGVSSALITSTLVFPPMAIAEPLAMPEVSANIQTAISSNQLSIGIGAVDNGKDTASDGADNDGVGEVPPLPVISVDDVPSGGNETKSADKQNHAPTPSASNSDANANNGVNTSPSTDDTDSAEARDGGPSLFAVVASGTWMGVTWQITDDNNPGTDYELYLGNPDGVTQEIFTASALLTAAPWYTNVTYRQNITEVNIIGPVRAPTSLANGFTGFTKLEAYKDHSPTPSTAFFNTASTTSMANLFQNSAVLTDIDGLKHWNVAGATNLSYMFRGCTGLVDLDAIKNWKINTGNTNATGMFLGCTGLINIDLSGWNTGPLTATSMFSGCTNVVGIDLSGWADSPHDASSMFSGCTSVVDIDLSGWKVRLKYIPSMFANCSSLETLTINNWDSVTVVALANANNAANIFLNTPNFKTLNMAGWTSAQSDSSIWSGSIMRIFTSTLTLETVDMSGWGSQPNVTHSVGMFQNHTALKKVDVSGWGSSYIKDMSYMFYGCTSLTSLVGLEDWNPVSATNLSYMFYDCTGLVDLDAITNWTINAGVVNKDMRFMFAGCTGLIDADLSGWSTTTMTFVAYMFRGCTNLFSVDISGLMTRGANGHASDTSDSRMMFNGANSLRVLTLGVNTVLSADINAGRGAGLLIPPIPPSNGRWRTLGTSTNIEKPNGDWNGTTAQLLARTNSGTVTSIQTYVWMPPLGFDNVPNKFDFGEHKLRPVSSIYSLDAGSYTPAEVATGFEVAVGSDGTEQWHATAELGPFTNSGGSVPAGVQVSIGNMSLSRTDVTVQPAQSPNLLSNNLVLTAGDSPTKFLSSPVASVGEGVWSVSMPFSDVELLTPPLNATNMGEWETTITWSLDNTP